MKKKYNFSYSEQKWQDFWPKSNIYQWNPTESRENTYIIDTPPPGVSGKLHMGHIYSYTHTDFIVRYKRMRGFNIFYPIGFDDNGLPTERLVEKKKNIRAKDLPREDFISICHDVVKEEEAKISELFDQIALSVDWSLKYQTISSHSRTISQMSFLDLVKKDQIYRKMQPVLWDVADQTALSQAEIEDRENVTFMNEILFRTDSDTIKIATTRPELLPACVCIFFHPDDKRYQHLENKSAISPLFEVQVPIIPDNMVDPEKGTGLVMCCTFGDQTDIEWWKKHNLPTKIIFTKYGTIKSDIEFDKNCKDINKARRFAQAMSNLSIQKAREKIIELLKENNLLVNQKEKIQTLKCGERSGKPLEILVTPQWFVKTIQHKDAMLNRSEELNWHPKSMKVKLDNWIKGINSDWCISRQRYFGVPFPVWYSKKSGEEGKILFAKKEQLPIDPLSDLPENYSREEVEPDYDVMDTWATSSVSPQINSHAISEELAINNQLHNKLFPADLRPQAHEIIRSWAYYTIVKSHLHQDCLPWSNIMISGWCLASDKSKMSKSKGNIIDPLKLLSQHGADIIRYWSASSNLGADTAYSENVAKEGKRLINKLWNASKFASQFIKQIPEGYKEDINLVKDKICCDFDKFFLKNLFDLVNNIEKQFENYEYAVAMKLAERFFWDIFCDNYIEIVKTRAYEKNSKVTLSSWLAIHFGLRVILKLFAPFMPYVTEEIYSNLYSSTSIHSSNSWERSNIFNDFNSKESKDLLIILDLVRKDKSNKNLSINAEIDKIIVSGTEISEDLLTDLSNVTSAKEIKFYNSDKDVISLDIYYPN